MVSGCSTQHYRRPAVEQPSSDNASTGIAPSGRVLLRDRSVATYLLAATTSSVGMFENVFLGSSNELGAFESGVAATLIGVGPAVVVGGVLTVGVVGVWWFLFPALRDVDRFTEVEERPLIVTPGGG